MSPTERLPMGGGLTGHLLSRLALALATSRSPRLYMWAPTVYRLAAKLSRAERDLWELPGWILASTFTLLGGILGCLALALILLAVACMPASARPPGPEDLYD